MYTRDSVITSAKKWLGVRWKHQGRGELGIDCVGLLCRVADDHDIPYEDRFGYSRQPNGHEFLAHLETYLTPGSIHDIRSGSVGVFRETVFPCHVGIFERDRDVLYLIHSSVELRCVGRQPMDQVTSLSLMRVLEFPGVV